jgi:hypothetical protein
MLNDRIKPVERDGVGALRFAASNLLPEKKFLLLFTLLTRFGFAALFGIAFRDARKVPASTRMKRLRHVFQREQVGRLLHQTRFVEKGWDKLAAQACRCRRHIATRK